MSNKTHTCDCGFSWKHGKSGNHWCPDGYRDKVTKLEAENKKLIDDLDKIAIWTEGYKGSGGTVIESCYNRATAYTRREQERLRKPREAGE